MPISEIVISPNVNSYYYSQATNNGLNVIGQSDFAHQPLQFQARPNYFAKSCMDDKVTLEFHTYYSGTSTLHLCSNKVDLSGNPTVITGADAFLNSAPTFKGRQVMPGNVWVDPYAGGAYGLTTSLWNFSWSDLSSYVTPDSAGTWYFIMLNVNGKKFYSEPILLRTSIWDFWGNNIAWRNTLLFNGYYGSNRAGNTNVVVSGWHNDYPTNLVPYTPNFYTRCEGYIIQDDPNLIAFEYLMQNYDANFISGQQIERQILKIGEASIGIPRYMQKMITEFLMCDRLSITQGLFGKLGQNLYYQYKLYNPNSNTQPQAIWKTKNDDNYPLIYSSIPLTLGQSSQNAMVDPIAIPTAHIYNGVYSDVFA